MPRRPRDLTVRSVSEFSTLFEPKGELYNTRLLWYRGEDRLRPSGALLPSIARRPSRLRDEWAIYQRFRQNAAAFVPHTSLTPWDWMLYMRHYGQHTRLLDWSESALVALYFAVERADRSPGVVWCLDPLRLNELAGHGARVHCAGIDTELDQYTTEAVKLSSAKADFKPVALIAPRSFPRLVAQQGVFTVTHRTRTALDQIPDATLLRRIRIPASAKPSMRDSLKTLGMGRLSLYPELQSLTGAD